MLKITVLTGALAIGLVGGAYAQATGPAAQTDNMNKPAMTNTNSKAMKHETTGTSSGGGSEVTDNGAPESMPKTTTGPAGAASNTESPPK